ncbi:hypothetical protein HK405_003787 [Cladochytrium tenue]|nr:hypothetical protein HK405_003787 [Cladochytrium tenue]
MLVETTEHQLHAFALHGGQNLRFPDGACSGGDAKAGVDAATENCHTTAQDQAVVSSGDKGAMLLQASPTVAFEANGTTSTSGTRLLSLGTETKTHVNPTNTTTLAQPQDTSLLDKVRVVTSVPDDGDPQLCPPRCSTGTGHNSTFTTSLVTWSDHILKIPETPTIAVESQR